jgi:UPF0176 protein
LTGRILLGEEGLNACVYGSEENVGKYKKELVKNPLFADVEFKDTFSEKTAYRKLVVRVRNQIVNAGFEVDLNNTGKFIEAEELKAILDTNEEVYLVDMRNDYEYDIGRFKNAIKIPTKNFRDLPKVMGVLDGLENKKVVTYCTGGIRCEKASAYLKENGFNDVSQLKGGVLRYAEKFPDTYWEGKCFVFDDRLAIDVNTSKDSLTQCKWCKQDGNYVNCHNLDCDKLFVCCDECTRLHKASCCAECEVAPKRRIKSAVIEVMN